MKELEEKTHSRLTSRKAFSSIHDKRAKFPSQNVKDVSGKTLDVFSIIIQDLMSQIFSSVPLREWKHVGPYFHPTMSRLTTRSRSWL
jgi:hypothetical protein